MTLHYHGTPITPATTLGELAGRNFCVSYFAPSQVETCHRIGQSVMLDNGAFSYWRKSTTPHDWSGYYEWCERWLAYPTTWAVIPDVINGDADTNDRLLDEWPFGDRGAPVWHMHEPLERLERLVLEWPLVCIGSSGAYKDLRTVQWHNRMHAVFNRLCSDDGWAPWLHMLRGMALVDGPYPFYSVDSTDVARNENRPQNDAAEMAKRWDSRQCPSRWEFREQLELVA